MKISDEMIIVRVLGDLINRDDLGRITDNTIKYAASNLYKLLCPLTGIEDIKEAEAKVLDILQRMHRRYLIDLKIYDDGTLGIIQILHSGINLYRQLEAV
ncbi:MAG: hypothetical protein AAGU75_00115 [Bacillota bacterium]